MTQWRAIPGFEGFYEISDLGDVRSLTRKDCCGRTRHARAMRSFSINKRSKHQMVALSRDAKSFHLLVSRLVLLAFVGPPPEGKPFALHNNGDPSDNSLNNLRWGDVQENYDDSVLHGRRPKDWQKSARVNSLDVERMRDLERAGLPVYKIAEWLGFNRKTAFQALRTAI